MAIHQITFSPTGGTRRVSELLCAGIGTTDTATELCSWEDDIAYPDIAADDLAVISMPVFAGRVPPPPMALPMTSVLTTNRQSQ